MSTIKVRRGLKSNLPKLNEGEIALATDSANPYIGTKFGNAQFAMVGYAPDTITNTKNNTMYKVWIGTQAEYKTATIPANTLCFITDGWLGNVKIKTT